MSTYSYKNAKNANYPPSILFQVNDFFIVMIIISVNFFVRLCLHKKLNPGLSFMENKSHLTVFVLHADN